MLLLTWHGTIVCLREGGGGLVHVPPTYADPSVAPLEVTVQPGDLRPEGERQMHPALGSITVRPAPAGHGITLSRYGKFLCAERDREQMAFDRPSPAAWESFLPIDAQDADRLRHLLSQRWIRLPSRQVLRRVDIAPVAGFDLRIGDDRLAHAAWLPLPPSARTMRIGGTPDAVELVQAERRGSALLQLAEWPVRSRRLAETLAVAVHRQLAGREPEQATFERDVAFLLDRDGPAGLEDLMERMAGSRTAEATSDAAAERVQPAPAMPVVPLGTACIVACTLRRMGLHQPPMPFDWLSTTPAMIRHCLETDFAVLLDRTQYRSLTGQGGPGEPDDGCAHEYYRSQHGIGRVFNHNDPTREADYRYTQACVDRLRDLLASPGPKLFVQIDAAQDGTRQDFDATAAMLDRLTTDASLLQIAVDPPGLRLAQPQVAVAARLGAHVLYRLQPTSALGGEDFLHTVDNDAVEALIGAFAGRPAAAVAAPPGVGQSEADIQQNLLGWAMREMAPWRLRPWNRDGLQAAFARLNATIPWAMLYRFEGGDVRVLPKAEMGSQDGTLADRAAEYLRFFRSVTPLLPAGFETTICMGLADKVVGKQDVPVFGFQKAAGENTLLVPDIDFLIADFYQDPGYADALEYDDKSRTAVFAGSTTGGTITPEIARDLSSPRLSAAGYFEFSTKVDFRLPNIVQCRSPEALAILREHRFCQKPRLSWAEQLDHRFIISIDGNGATCSRVAISLLSNSVLLKYESRDVLYYFAGLQPWLHYLPVEQHGDIEAALALEAADPEPFRQMASAGTAFARTYLTPERARQYTAWLLKLYADTLQQGGSAPPTPVAQATGAPARPAGVVAEISNVTIVAHVQDHGDVKTRADAWTGRRGSGLPIEGFAIHLGLHLPARGFFYQAALAPDRFSDRAVAGDYRGTRGQNTPVFGIRIMLEEPASDAFEIDLEASFTDGSHVGPIRGTPILEIVSEAPLEAIRLVVKERKSQ